MHASKIFEMTTSPDVAIFVMGCACLCLDPFLLGEL